MTSSERDLVTALRNELASIDPARPCDRLAEAAGLGAAVPGREPAVARLAHRLRRAAEADGSDGGAFDFRGEGRRAIGSRGRTLANSNQRGMKGFITTYEVERTIGPAGKYKLDWIFVKPPGVTKPRAKKQPHRFAPHFGRTLRTLNYSGEGRISDHNPIAVDLPFDEPRIRR